MNEGRNTVDGDRARIARLHDGTAELVRATDERDLYGRVVDIADQILAFDQSVVHVRDGDRYVSRAASSHAADRFVPVLPVDSLAGEVDRSQESMLVTDAADEPGAYTDDHAFRSGVLVPLGNGAVFQALSTEPHAYDRTDLELAELLCSYAAEVLGRIEAEAESERRRERVTQLHRAATELVALTDPDELYRQVTEVAAEMLDFEHAVVFTTTDDRFVRRAEASAADDTYPAEYPLDHGAMAVVRERGDSLLVEDAETNPNASNETVNFRSGVIVPLGDDGVFQGLSWEPGAFDEGDRELAELLCSYATETLARIDARQELQRQNERLDEFASVVSHDLRNPLNVAEGYLELARESGDETDFDRVAAAHDRMGDLASELLTLAREGRDVAEPETVALSSVIRRAWANVETGDLRLGDLPDAELEADPDRLRELFENLFRNTVEHGDSATTVTVDTLMTRDDGDRTAGFYVADDGPGFDAGVDLFEAGVTTDPDGTGFGLSIVRQIAEAHGWQVEAVDENGARFEFHL